LHDGRVGQGHCPGDPAQQHATDGDDAGEAVHQLEHQLAAPDDDGNADQQAEDHQRHFVLVGGALRRAGNGNDVVHAHHQVGHDHRLDGRPQLVAGGDLVATFIVGRDQLDADPHQQQGADDLQEGQRQQRQREEDQDHAQHDGAYRAPDDALGALGWRQLAARQCDDDGVVTAQQNVDHDDLTDGDPEFRGHELFHGAWFLCGCTLAKPGV
jgi:hypothetical protein